MDFIKRTVKWQRMMLVIAMLLPTMLLAACGNEQSGTSGGTGNAAATATTAPAGGEATATTAAPAGGEATATTGAGGAAQATPTQPSAPPAGSKPAPGTVQVA